MTVFNPFIVGTYVSEQYFCDRKEEKRILIDHIRNGRNAVLFSERRMGKTGLIQHVFHDQKIQEDFHCLYFDAFACGNIQEFTFALSNCIFRSLKKSVGYLEKLSTIFNRVGFVRREPHSFLTFDLESFFLIFPHPLWWF